MKFLCKISILNAKFLSFSVIFVVRYIRPSIILLNAFSVLQVALASLIVMEILRVNRARDTDLLLGFCISFSFCWVNLLLVYSCR